MTERKPAGMSFETWVDNQISRSIARGDFEDLPGAGKPIPGIERAVGGRYPDPGAHQLRRGSEAGRPERMTGVLLDVTELFLAQRAVERLNQSLERRVEERTAALQQALREIESFSY
jgi:hypothetical protein